MKVRIGIALGGYADAGSGAGAALSEFLGRFAAGLMPLQT